MPTIAIVDDIRIVIFPNDHDPPHFHAFLAEHKVRVDVVGIAIMGGRGPAVMERKLLTWAAEHRDELLTAWNAVRSGRPPERIE